MASLWQQAGRAGRREQPSTSIYIAFDGPLDQFFMKQPDKLFGRAIECAQVPCTLGSVLRLLDPFLLLPQPLEHNSQILGRPKVGGVGRGGGLGGGYTSTASQRYAPELNSQDGFVA